MRCGGERGSALLGMLVILSMAIFILISLGLVLRQYLLQERHLQSSFEWERDRTAELRAGVEDLQLSKWEVVGMEEWCRVFGGEVGYIFLSPDWYGRKLSVECFSEYSREILGVYSVGKGVQYTYLVQDQLVSPIELIDGWRMDFDDANGVTLQVNYAGDAYHYEFPDYKVGSKLRILRSVASEGFYLLIDHELWLLPKSLAGEGRFVTRIDFVGEELIADFIDDEGVYILWGRASRDGATVYSGTVRGFYSLVENKKNIKGRAIVQKDIKFDSYEVVAMDRYKVVVKLRQFDSEYLFAIMWDGRTVWGGRYIWERSDSIDCPLQSEKFEPVVGWVLGCQRRFGKVGFKGSF